MNFKEVFYRLEWKCSARWVRIGENTSDAEEALFTKKLLTERAFDDGRTDKYRLIRVTEEEVIG